MTHLVSAHEVETLRGSIRGTLTSHLDERRGSFSHFILGFVLLLCFYPAFLKNHVWDLVFCVSLSLSVSVLTANETRAPAASSSLFPPFALCLLICFLSLIHICVLGRRYFFAS